MFELELWNLDLVNLCLFKVCCIGPNAQSLESVLRDIKEKYNTPTLALTANLIDPNAPAHIVTLVEKHLGPIDFLINITAASYFRSFTREKDIMLDWWPSIEQNLRGPIALTHAVLPSMIVRQTGVIISTTSLVGIMQFPFASCQGSVFLRCQPRSHTKSYPRSEYGG